MKPTREEMLKKIGTRESLPGGSKQLSPQMMGRSAAKEKALSRVAEDDRPGVDKAVTLDPKRNLDVRAARAGLAKGGWIKDAIKKPGALRESMGAKEGEPIPAKKLAAAAKQPGKTGQRARLAQTLKGFKK